MLERDPPWKSHSWVAELKNKQPALNHITDWYTEIEPSAPNALTEKCSRNYKSVTNVFIRSHCGQCNGDSFSRCKSGLMSSPHTGIVGAASCERVISHFHLFLQFLSDVMLYSLLAQNKQEGGFLKSDFHALQHDERCQCPSAA